MNHPTIPFQFAFKADGSSESVSINLSSGPVIYDLPPSTGTGSLGGAFNATASGTSNMGVDSGLTFTSASILLGILTVNFTGTVDAGTIVTVSGYLIY